MALRLNGSNSGYVELEAPATAASNTLTLPNGNGSSGNFLRTDGSGTLTWATPADTDTTGWTLDTTGSSLSSQSSVSFTNIPSTATKIILGFEDLVVGSNHNWRIRLGHDSTFGGFSYHVTSWYVGPNTSYGSQMTGSFQTYGMASTSYTAHGLIELDNIYGNYWYGRASISTETNNGYIFAMFGYGDGGSNVLDRVAIATTSSTFSSGTAYCHYLEA